MATALFFHAHPDDECILTGGTMARLATEGHRVVLVAATRGEQGEVAPGFLADGETLGQRRSEELRASAQVLGVSRLEFLGYGDSGMMGTATNEAPGCFWQADLDEAAHRLAAILIEEAASVLVVYDSHGGYGHPDQFRCTGSGSGPANWPPPRRCTRPRSIATGWRP
jgi:LmbE family N-acetylglucosaminyl deacetylase